MTQKLARRTFNNPYECQKPWPEECFVQAGDDGLVIGGKEGAYMTAFFEAFPTCNGVSTFLRGEGATAEEAEANAWVKFERANACMHDQGWDRKGYTNGGAFCNGCGMFHGKHFPPTTLCCICNEPTNNSRDIDDNWYCEEHEDLKPEDKKTSVDRMFERTRASLAALRERKSTN